LDHGPGRIRHARDFMGVRANAATNGTGNRLYALFSTPNLTSAVADHGIALTSSAIEHAALRMVQLLGLPAPAAQPVTGVPEAWLSACVEDLKRSGKASLVVAGANQSPLMHALAHAMNKMLGSAGECLTYSAPVCANPENHTDSLRGLVHDMAAGNVDTLIVLGGNPLYSTPADSGFAEALSHVATSVHCGGYANETAARCHWHIPQAHFLEAWSDARAHDGTASIQQPLLAPLYGGRSPHELLAVLGGDTMTSGHDIVRGFWRSKLGADFETVWNTALRNGLVANTAFAARTATPKTDFLSLLPQPGGKLPVASLEVSFLPDASVWDGSYSNNAWLQELPRPFSKLTWDNAAYVSPTLAERLSLVNEDVVELSYRGRRVQAPIWITPGHADDTISVALGYGRTHAGRVGNGCGFNAYSLRTLDAPWFASGVEIRNTGKKYALSTTQQHHSMEGRDIVRVHALTAAGGYTKSSQKKREAAEGSLYPPFKYDGYAWGMAIDLSSCIGCNACTIACQAENNIPVVGKAEVARGREMHWIRVDRYYQGTPYRPRAHFQPVPCMQCENAPCEVVCPVEASVHDSEGLNVQVYNRCVGTRFCSNNCPYKVRRFNFYQYVDENTESLKAQRNPEVTVRMRGVMEKCSYCVQRIANARIEAEKDDRRIRDGDVVTACQAVCPTQAITFGDLNDPASRVNAVKASPLNYALLAELNTKPRTTYLAKLTNLNPAVRED
jgi:molybdopterin-containing oxidoreductase family iron-sulfur binding subunit